ncbi:unnamed protein product [Darwinula stevensoni]|uniref:DOMON domain-containing protein n=1 Tax=Darwinula stevensoni TaxID=69355 RepID=A0A7R9AFG7_9CRUS|nr:unnamed protein product [Darwinula stevensoni]CAG0903301.1 unnamed protein product [Darwinula stevensoni]
MAGILLQCVVVAVFAFGVCWGLPNQSRWARTEALDSKGQVRLHWTPRITKGDIQFLFVAPSTGWVGVGFSPNGGMIGADMVIGGIRNGSPYFRDCHSVGNTLPDVDIQQDYELVRAMENGTHTWLHFSRKINTTDLLQDYQITNEAVDIIWAYGERDPRIGEEPAYHALNRGERSLSILDAIVDVGQEEASADPSKNGTEI